MEKQNLSPPCLSGNYDKVKQSLSQFFLIPYLPSVWPRLLGFYCSPWDFQSLSWAQGCSVSKPWSSVATGKSHFYHTRQQKVPSLLPSKIALNTVPAEGIRVSKEGYFWFPQLLRLLHSTEMMPYLHCSSCTSCSGRAGPMQTPPAGWGWGLREPSPAETTTPHRKGLLFVLKEQKNQITVLLHALLTFSLVLHSEWWLHSGAQERESSDSRGGSDPSRMVENTSMSQL